MPSANAEGILIDNITGKDQKADLPIGLKILIFVNTISNHIIITPVFL